MSNEVNRTEETPDNKKTATKKHGSTILLILVFITGISLLIYPTVSDNWNSMHQTRKIVSYTETVDDLDRESYSKLMEAADEFNAELYARQNHFSLTDDEKARYESLLNLSGDGVMGYIEIPDIDVYMPIYHGTSTSILQVAAGHLEWSSLPVGGENTHTVLSGHRGLPGAKLFTDIDKLETGDTFMLHVLNETLTYQVDQILTVEPTDVLALDVVEGRDLCTLVTCTPYGINTHRLLVRGTRVENAEEAPAVHIKADAQQLSIGLEAIIIAVPLLVIILIIDTIVLSKKRKKRR